MSVLELAGLAKRYAGFEFGPVDLAVGEEVLCVLGPSGSGKTTLLSLVAGLVTADAGSVSLDGRSLDGLPPERRNAGVVFQDGALFPHLTARENVAYAATDEGRVADLAALLELDDVLDRRPATLSGGERQRVALARTLAADPDVLLLDEPLSSLDAPIRRRLREDLHDLFAALAVPVVYVTHDQRTATALGDRLAVLREGRLEQVDTPRSVLERPATRFVAEFTGCENVYEVPVVGSGEGVVRVRLGDATLRVRSATAKPTSGATVTACVHPSRVRLDGAVGALDGPSAPDQSFPGTVRRWLDEGDQYRVVVALDAGVDLAATVSPATADRLASLDGAAVSVAIPPDAVHVLS
nr:ABC transporter ATP-binding protein [Halomarina rubra]